MRALAALGVGLALRAGLASGAPVDHDDLAPTPRSVDDSCVDWDDGQDFLGSDCDEYRYDVEEEGINALAICGIFDDDDFTATEFCCVQSSVHMTRKLSERCSLASKPIA